MRCVVEDQVVNKVHLEMLSFPSVAPPPKLMGMNANANDSMKVWVLSGLSIN